MIVPDTDAVSAAAPFTDEKHTIATTVQAIATTFIMVVTFPRFIAGFKIARTRLSSCDLQAMATDGESASSCDRTARATSTRC